MEKLCLCTIRGILLRKTQQIVDVADFMLFGEFIPILVPLSCATSQDNFALQSTHITGSHASTLDVK